MADYAKIVAVGLLARIVEEGATQHGLPLLEGHGERDDRSG